MVIKKKPSDLTHQVKIRGLPKEATTREIGNFTRGDAILFQSQERGVMFHPDQGGTT